MMVTTKKAHNIKNIAIEGNIGCGKSSFMKYFKDIPNVQTYLEPIDKWQNVNGYNLLELYYQDPKKYGFMFQMLVQETLMEVLYKPTDSPYKIIERSIYSAKYTFVENMFKNKILNEMEYLVYSRWFDFISQILPIKLDLIVYLQCDPDTCYERIKRRARMEESLVSFDLINQLHQLHEFWLIKKGHADFNIPVYVINACQTEVQMKKCASELIKFISENNKILRIPLNPISFN